MIHALRRVSFSTCLSDLFAFAARDPGQPLDKQFCHVFRTKQVRTLLLYMILMIPMSLKGTKNTRVGTKFVIRRTFCPEIHLSFDS